MKKQMKINIPCNECLVLAICKHKDKLVCQLLYDYMDIHLCTNKGKRVGMKQYGKDKNKIWNQIAHQFRKDDQDMFIDAPNSDGVYILTKEERTYTNQITMTRI